VTPVVAVLMALACWLAMPPPAHKRLRTVLVGSDLAPDRQLPMPLIAAVSLGLGIAVLLGSALGLLAGALGAVLAFRFTRRLETRADRDRRVRLARQLPDVCDLLAATLASGAPVHTAVTAVARACGGPASEALLRVVAALQLGSTASTAWQELASEPAFDRVSAAFRRSAVSGAPIADVLRGVAEDERRRHKSRVEVAARSAGVRTVAPLVACFLPAFILLGIVPVVGSLATNLFPG